ncbi:hypothetical protein PPACK8108_LOCUS14127 [Phakopsora pachyrhizi]|uniref:F-box domain-containing protein n=1 Tax=Phakopsora pachyrhizi TaxID=170000 RepID=A0AAV0B4L8_PHAPC|nr:hypothetical protein PPACK8108_LOCUS14127 [Phakopsora pachyrhizi]
MANLLAPTQASGSNSKEVSKNKQPEASIRPLRASGQKSAAASSPIIKSTLTSIKKPTNKPSLAHPDMPSPAQKRHPAQMISTECPKDFQHAKVPRVLMASTFKKVPWFNQLSASGKHLIPDMTSVAFLPDASQSLLPTKNEDKNLNDHAFNNKYYNVLCEGYQLEIDGDDIEGTSPDEEEEEEVNSMFYDGNYGDLYDLESESDKMKKWGKLLKEARQSINVYGKILFESKGRDQYQEDQVPSAINLLIDFIRDPPCSIHHLSMTRIPDYLMDSVINQVSARDLSAEQPDQNRPSRLEQKRWRYLIKLKLDCLLIFKRSAMRRQSKHQGRVLSQTNGIGMIQNNWGYYQVVQQLRDFKPSHQETKPPKNKQLYLEMLNLLDKGIQLEQLKKYHKLRPDGQTGEVKDEPYWRYLRLPTAWLKLRFIHEEYGYGQRSRREPEFVLAQSGDWSATDGNDGESIAAEDRDKRTEEQRIQDKEDKGLPKKKKKKKKEAEQGAENSGINNNNNNKKKKINKNKDNKNKKKNNKK